MASTGGGESTDLIQELFDNPQQFDFFQAVRLLEMYVAQQRNHPRASAVGSDVGPHTEPIRFRALPSLSFPPGQIAGLKAQKEVKGPSTDDKIPVDMTVSFMGLTGPSGVLPQHYTSLLIERSHPRNKDQTLREFFDLFNHRAVSLFYRAWEKYRFIFSYQRNLQDGEFEDDLFTRCLFSLVGLEVPGLRHRFQCDDQTILSYGGLFAQRCRNVIGLQQLLSDYFRVKVEVQQFVGQWLYLPIDSQSSLSSAANPIGLNLELGTSAVIGSRVWDVQSRIRIRLGPLTRNEFDRLIPQESGLGARHADEDRLKSITELVRFYVGAEKDFDIQLVLKKEEVPPFRFPVTGKEKLHSAEADDGYEPRLGWNTWMASETRTRDAEDAVFCF